MVVEQVLAAFEGRVDIPMPKEWSTAYEVLRRSKSADHHAALGAIVAGFTEGHGIPDLVEARALLADAGATVAVA